MCVDIPFGSRTITGYVIEVTDKPEYDPARTKPLIGVKADSVAVEAKLIALCGMDTAQLRLYHESGA